MPSIEKVTRTNAGLASELRTSVARLRRRIVNERDPANELSLGAAAVLGILTRHGEKTIGELAAHERVQPPSMTRTVNRLHEGGYVERRPHPTDRRVVVIALTDLGRETVHRDRRRRDVWLAQRLAELTDDERTTLRAAAPILERLASD